LLAADRRQRRVCGLPIVSHDSFGLAVTDEDEFHGG